MQPAFDCLRCGMAKPRHVEHGGQIDRDHLVPVVGRVLLDRQRQPGDAGIVDQHVEPAEGGDRRRHHGLDLGALTHVAAARNEAGDLLGQRRQRTLVDVADENLAAVGGEGAREFAADAGGAGGDQNALNHGAADLLLMPAATMEEPARPDKGGGALRPRLRSARDCSAHDCSAHELQRPGHQRGELVRKHQEISDRERSETAADTSLAWALTPLAMAMPP